jgi:hypothetical protein
MLLGYFSASRLPVSVRMAGLSGVNYFFWSTTIISPDQRQLLLTSSAGAKRHRGRGAKPARVWGFPSFLSF